MIPFYSQNYYSILTLDHLNSRRRAQKNIKSSSTLPKDEGFKLDTYNILKYILLVSEKNHAARATRLDHCNRHVHVNTFVET